MTREIYYDNSATTRTREEAAKLVYEMLTDHRPLGKPLRRLFTVFLQQAGKIAP